MTLKDLARYRAKWRKPIVGTFRGKGLIGMRPPTSGGIAIQEWLNILEGYDLKKLGRGSADTLHLIAEAQKLAWADRNQYVGDPDFVRVPTKTLISKRYAARRRAEIDPQHAKAFGPGDVKEARAHGLDDPLSVIDRKGNAVAVTCTIEQEFGSAVVAPKRRLPAQQRDDGLRQARHGQPGAGLQAPALVHEPRDRRAERQADRRHRRRPAARRIITGTFFGRCSTGVEYGLPLASAVDAPAASTPSRSSRQRGGPRQALHRERADTTKAALAGPASAAGTSSTRQGAYDDPPARAGGRVTSQPDTRGSRTPSRTRGRSKGRSSPAPVAATVASGAR